MSQAQQDVPGRGPQQPGEARDRAGFGKESRALLRWQLQVADGNLVDSVGIALAEARPDPKAARIAAKWCNLPTDETRAREYLPEYAFLVRPDQHIQIVAGRRDGADDEHRLVERPVKQVGRPPRSTARDVRAQVTNSTADE